MIPLTADFYPFVLANYKRGSFSNDDFRAMFERMNEISRRAIADRTYYVVVSLGGSDLNAADRKFVAELTNECPKQYMERTIGSFVIVPSAIVRGMITALRWVAPALAMVEPVASVDEAINAGVARFGKHRITIDSAVVAGARLWLQRAHQPTKLDAPDAGR